MIQTLVSSNAINIWRFRKFNFRNSILFLDFTTMSGTSMACPHVAGAAALIMKNDNSLTPAEVKQKIKDLSTDDIDRSAQSAAVRAASDSKRLYVPTSL